MNLKALLSLALFTSTVAQATTGYYRYADIHKDQVVFTAEGDLWVAKTNKPQARRLTTHTAQERYASISPDGTKVAYIADYEGSTDVYVIPIDGGVAKRVSFENGFALVHGWTPDGGVIYSTNSRIGPPRNWSLKIVYPDTLLSKPIAVADAREGVMDKDGKYVYFSQFGVDNYADNVRTYRGGAEGEIWRYEYGSNNEAKLLTGEHTGNARQPMTYKGWVYFISDASGVDNLWKMKSDGTNYKQLTENKQWPVRNAKLSEGKIVYQSGADIKLLNLSNMRSKTLDLSLSSDFPNLRERWLNEPLSYSTSMNFAAAQEKVAITARGRVALAGTDKSRTVEISTPVHSRTRDAYLSHDGKWVYAINDSSGEQEIWRFAADGTDNAKQLTQDGTAYRWGINLSDDGKYIAHDDKNGDLWLLSLESLENKKIATQIDGVWPAGQMNFSHDSRFLTFAIRGKEDERKRVALYSIEQQRLEFLTSDKYASYSPTFSADDKWLYFLSERNFSPSPSHPWGDRNMGPQLDRRGMIFAYGLDADAKFAFQTPNELMTDDTDKKPGKENKQEHNGNKEDKPAKPLDWQGIKKRLWQVPVPAGNYWDLSLNKQYLYVMDRATEPGSANVLKSIKIEPQPKLENFSFAVDQYQLSADGKTMMVRKGSHAASRMYIVPANAKLPKDLSKSKVLTNQWSLLIDPKDEWRQMFHDAWLQHRDTLFDKNLRGVDWSQAEKKYRPLLDRVTDRWELNDLLAQMVGELNTLHSQVRPGDVPTPDNRARQANLGAALEQHKDGVKIATIYRHNPELPWRAPPLRQPGVDAEQGDIIQAVNGKKVGTIAQLIAALRNQVGKQVLLTLSRAGKEHKTVVVPSSTSADELHRYKHWVNVNRDKVESAPEKLGYMHFWTMGSRDLSTFAEDFYTNIHKHGLIIDVRRNRGGNIDSIIIEKLLRKAWMYWSDSENSVEPNLQNAFRGHLVVLADQGTYSDGETFTAAIKALGLGPVIGKRTAGAGVFLTDRNRLVDFGMVRAAEMAQFAPDGRWIIEGHGVAPTIEVDNLPHASFKGEDAQLQRAISYLQQKLKEQPIQPLKIKPFPAQATPAEDIK